MVSDSLRGRGLQITQYCDKRRRILPHRVLRPCTAAHLYRVAAEAPELRDCFRYHIGRFEECGPGYRARALTILLHELASGDHFG
jgi:hypothetical protein